MSADHAAVEITTPEQFIELCEHSTFGKPHGRIRIIKTSLRKVIKKDGAAIAYRSCGKWSWDRKKNHHDRSYSFNEWAKRWRTA